MRIKKKKSVPVKVQLNSYENKNKENPQEPQIKKELKTKIRSEGEDALGIRVASLTRMQRFQL